MYKGIARRFIPFDELRVIRRLSQKKFFSLGLCLELAEDEAEFFPRKIRICFLS